MSLFKNYIPTEGYTEIVKPGEMGITKLHFGILTLTAEATFFDHSDDTAVALIALGGHSTLLVGHNGNKANGVLGERPDVFHGEVCIAYIPHHTTYELFAGESGIEIAVCKVPSHSESAAVILDAGESIDENETHFRVWENIFLPDSDVSTPKGQPMSIEEAICLHRFRDADGTAICNITRSPNAVDVRLSHNDVLVISEHDHVGSLAVQGVGYQLWVQPI